MKKTVTIFLFCLIFFSLIKQTEAALLLIADTSSAHLNRLTKKKVYLINESRKTNVPEKKRNEHKASIEAINLQLNEIYAARRNAAILSGNKQLLDQYKKDSTERAGDFDIAGLFNPELYPVESKAVYIGGNVTFLAVNHYTAPWRFSIDRTFSPKITVGIFFGHYTEITHLDKGYSTAEWSYTAKSRNYTYSNYMFGLQGAYHLFNPEKPLFNLPVTKWDFYISGMAGYTISTKPDPFLKNKAFDASPVKNGIAFGIFPGLKYYIDEHLAFSAEIGFGSFGYASAGICYKIVNSKAVVIEEKKKGKSQGKSSSKGKGKGKNQKKKK